MRSNDGCMRRSCGNPVLRNNDIGDLTEHIRGNSCTASLAQERVVLHLPVLHLGRLLVILVLPTKRAIDSRARSYRMGGVHPTGCLAVGHNPVVELKVRPTGLFSPHRPRPTSTSRCLVVETASPPALVVQVRRAPKISGQAGRPTRGSANHGGPIPVVELEVRPTGKTCAPSRHRGPGRMLIL